MLLDIFLGYQLFVIVVFIYFSIYNADHYRETPLIKNILYVIVTLIFSSVLVPYTLWDNYMDKVKGIDYETAAKTYNKLVKKYCSSSFYRLLNVKYSHNAVRMGTEGDENYLIKIVVEDNLGNLVDIYHIDEWLRNYYLNIFSRYPTDTYLKVSALISECERKLKEKRKKYPTGSHTCSELDTIIKMT